MEVVFKKLVGFSKIRTSAKYQNWISGYIQVRRQWQKIA